MSSAFDILRDPEDGELLLRLLFTAAPVKTVTPPVLFFLLVGLGLIKGDSFYICLNALEVF